MRRVVPHMGALLLGLALLVTWELAGRFGWLESAFVSSPTRVVEALAGLIQSGELVDNLRITGGRMVVALIAGGGLGLILGLFLGLSRGLRQLLDPFIAALHPVPRMALLPIVLMLFGLGFFSKTLVVAISCFFPMVINTTAGVRQVDANYLDAARLFGATRARTLRRVVLPASLPMILAGARLSLTRVLGSTVGLELITADTGLGAMLFMAWQTYRSEDLYATVVVIAVLGILFRFVVDTLSRRLVPWQDPDAG